MHNFGGGRTDVFNSGGKRSKEGRDIFKIQGGVGLKGGVKKFRGVWTLQEAMHEVTSQY